MATYLYCVLTPATEPPPGLAGVGGAPVRALALDDSRMLSAWVATVQETALRVRGRALGAQALLHDAVVSAALATGHTPLPSRFGSYFATDDACVASFTTRTSELERRLERLAGTVEMAVLLVPPRQTSRAEPPRPAVRDQPAAGRRYLEMLRQRERASEATQATIERTLDDIRHSVSGITREESRSRTVNGVVSLAHLVQREHAERYREAVRAVTPREGVRVVVAGPRAPYSFAGRSLLMAGHDSSSPDDSG